MNKEELLKDIVVLELASVLAGPNVGAGFAELGATVIKVENLKTKGDVTRTWKLPTEEQDNDVSGYFSCANWGKKSISIDITKKQGLKIIFELVKKSDIILVNYKPGDAEKLKVDYKTLNKLNKKIIYAHITGYGLEIPWAGYDAIIQAESGFTFMNGDPKGDPTKMPVALMDLLAAHNLKEGILLALLKREKTGKGTFVTSSLIQAGVSSLANQATNWLVGNTNPSRMGSDHPNIVPYGTVFHTKDKKELVLAIGSDRQFEQLCEILGKPEIAKDIKFKTNFDRVKNRDEIKKILQDLILKVERDKLLEILRKKKIPSGAVNTIKEVFEHPQSQYMILKGTTGTGKEIKGHRTVCFHFENEEINEGISAPPHYGEHSIHILRDFLGYECEEIKKLISEDVIYARNEKK